MCVYIQVSSWGAATSSKRVSTPQALKPSGRGRFYSEIPNYGIEKDNKSTTLASFVSLYLCFFIFLKKEKSHSSSLSLFLYSFGSINLFWFQEAHWKVRERERAHIYGESILHGEKQKVYGGTWMKVVIYGPTCRCTAAYPGWPH